MTLLNVDILTYFPKRLDGQFFQPLLALPNSCFKQSVLILTGAEFWRILALRFESWIFRIILNYTLESPLNLSLEQDPSSSSPCPCPTLVMSVMEDGGDIGEEEAGGGEAGVDSVCNVMGLLGMGHRLFVPRLLAVRLGMCDWGG